MISISLATGREDASLGVIAAQGLEVIAPSIDFERDLSILITDRKNDLPHDLEECRTLSRRLLRHGVYKPSGRSKPASEFLLRAAREDAFPRVSQVVDCVNYVSLRTMLPISIWDVRQIPADSFLFAHGLPGEKYVFNSAGHEINLEDLITGFAVSETDRIPIVNPVKDSMRTKIAESTDYAVAVIYCHNELPENHRENATRLLADLLSECGRSVAVNSATCLDGETVRI